MDIQDFKFSSNGILPTNFVAKWQAPSNIALVKYWGKTEPQIPKNASISFTLKNCHTITKIKFSQKSNTEQNTLQVYFDGTLNEAFKPKIETFLERIHSYCPYLSNYNLLIETHNSFPHSSGIASSASGFAAIALCVMSLEKEIDATISQDFFAKKASFLARLGSGSASRSIQGPLVVWGNHNDITYSSDLFGVEIVFDMHPIFQNYQDTILLVDKGEKQVSSTVGHQLMINHPFAEQRFLQANENLKKLKQILIDGNCKEFIQLVESEALTLHAMMLTSHPYFILMKPNTLEIITKIWQFRAATKTNICFTLDAGANVHVLYPENEKAEILQFIDTELSKFCKKNEYICDEVSLGALKI